MRRALLAAAISGLMTGAASAGWFSQKEDNPFEGTTAHIAVTVSGPSVFGFRCATKASEEPALLFVLPEEGTDEAAEGLGLMGTGLAVIVDDDPRLVVERVKVDIVQIGAMKRFRLIARDEKTVAIARRISAAKKRVAVAAIIGGKAVHPTIFGVSGSRRALDGAMQSCGVPAN